MPDLPNTHNRVTGAVRHSTAAQDSKARQASRQYKTNSRTWRSLRAQQLRTEPLCRACRANGRTTIANEVDHIDGDSWNNHTDNFQSLCKPCHSRKTAKEQAGVG